MLPISIVNTPFVRTVLHIIKPYLTPEKYIEVLVDEIIYMKWIGIYTVVVELTL